MRRREFIRLFGSTAVAAWPLSARAQQASKIYRIGFLSADLESGMAKRVEAFRMGLRDLGYVEGTNLAIEYRFANEKYERLFGLAGELIRSNVDLIATHGTPGSLAAKRATATIPIVMLLIGDPVASGVVPSLARPGGNITGQSFFLPELCAKRIELLKLLVPQLMRVAVLFNPSNPIFASDVRHMEQAAQHLNMELLQFPVHGPSEFESAFERMEQERVEALATDDDSMLVINAAAITALAAKHRLGSIGTREFAQAEGLMGYGVDIIAAYRHAAVFVDKVFKGTKPADIPIEQATKFEFILNLRAAKALSIKISDNVLSLADEVIE